MLPGAKLHLWLLTFECLSLYVLEIEAYIVTTHFSLFIFFCILFLIFFHKCMNLWCYMIVFTSPQEPRQLKTHWVDFLERVMHILCCLSHVSAFSCFFLYYCFTEYFSLIRHYRQMQKTVAWSEAAKKQLKKIKIKNKCVSLSYKSMFLLLH